MTLSLDLRRRVVSAYRAGLTQSYQATAQMFGIGRATVSRLLRRQRETGDVCVKPRGGNRKRIVDLDWLRGHAQAHPDARLRDRIDAWIADGGQPLGLQAMCNAMAAIGWTHKKRRPRPESATKPSSKPSAATSSKYSPSCSPPA